MPLDLPFYQVCLALGRLNSYRRWGVLCRTCRRSWIPFPWWCCWSIVIPYEPWLALELLLNMVLWAGSTNRLELVLDQKSNCPSNWVARLNLAAFINWEFHLILLTRWTWNPEESECLDLEKEHGLDDSNQVWTLALCHFFRQTLDAHFLSLWNGITVIITII